MQRCLLLCGGVAVLFHFHQLAFFGFHDLLQEIIGQIVLFHGVNGVKVYEVDELGKISQEKMSS